MNEENATQTTPFYGLDDQTSVPITLLCGIQHVLAMFVGIITPPLIIAGALSLSLADSAFLISMALFTSGITTFIQVRRFGPFGSGLLSVQGTSFTFVPLAIQSGTAGGLPLIFGLSIAAAPLQMILSRFLGFARRLFPPIVTGSVVLLIGMSLIRVGMRDMAGGAGVDDFGHPRHLLLGAFVLITIILLNRFGRGVVATISIALGLLCGYVLAALLGRIDFAPLAEAGWWTVPQPLHYGLSFDAIYLLPWLIAYFVTTLESIGDLTATSQVSRQPVDGPVFLRRIKGGVLADGFNSIIAGCFNAMPNTTFSQNNGVIGLTGVAARRVGYAVAAWLVLLGLFPKFAALISIMPKPVLGGATVVMFAMVAVAGLRIAFRDGLTLRNELILAVTLALGMGVIMVPDAVANLQFYDGDNTLLRSAQQSLQIVAQSGLAVGAITAATLNLIFPERSDEADRLS